jgi:DNA-binding beta-propeller fold protein YncE
MMVKKKKSGHPRPGAAVKQVVHPTVQPETPKKAFYENSSFWVFLIVVIFVVGLFWKNASFSGFESKPKMFPVQLVDRFSGDQKPSGIFGTWGVTGLPNGNIALTDNNSKRLLIFDLNGKLLKSVVRRGKTMNDFNDIRSISSDAKGNIYVFDTATVNIFEFSPEGKFLKVIALGKIGGFYGPIGFCCVGDHFVIADTGSHRIMTLNADGTVASVWGSHGKDKDQLANPLAIAADDQGRYYIADSDNNRIKITDAAGKTIRIINVNDRPFGLALDKQGRIYTAFNDDNFIKVYSSQNGRYLGTFDPAGDDSPHRQVIGVCVTPDGLIVGIGVDTVSVYKVTATP